ncbi:unnamed protein product [Ixodes hexagonus]
MASSRKQYSAAFRRKVILMAESIGNSAAGRKFTVNEGSIRGWQKQNKLFSPARAQEVSGGPNREIFCL